MDFFQFIGRSGGGIREFNINLAFAGALEISGKRTVFGTDNDVLAGVAGADEFMAGVAANGAAFGLHGYGFYATAAENPLIGPVHVLIGFIEAFKRTMKTIGVFHEKFAHPKQAVA